MRKFVRVQFYNSSKLYDYMCDIDDIKKGDKVYVTTRDGSKVVTVRGIFYSELADMPLPEYCYKSVDAKYLRPKVQPKEPEAIGKYPEDAEEKTLSPKIKKKSSACAPNTPQNKASVDDSYFVVIDSDRGIRRGKNNRNFLLYDNHADKEKHKFLLLRYRLGMNIRRDWFITDMLCMKKGDFVYVNENARNCDPGYGRVEKIFEGTYAELNSSQTSFRYVDRIISDSEIIKAKKSLGILMKEDYYTLVKDWVIILLIFAYIYYVFFSEAGQQARQISSELDRDFIRGFPRRF